MLSTIIFSKDRAAQLDLCLKSFFRNASMLDEGSYIGVVYTASTPKFQSAYDVIKREHRNYYLGSPQIFWFGEDHYGGFREALSQAMPKTTEYYLFLTDDDIIYSPMETDLMATIHQAMQADVELMTVSLRLGKNTFVQDHHNNSICTIPDEVNKGTEQIRVWNWKDQLPDTNFAYPFSLDGHFFKKSVVECILDKVPDWYNPNSLEGKACNYVRDMGFGCRMGCFEQSYLVNTPLNRVQETCLNRAGEFFPSSPEELNSRVLGGERLTLDGMDFSTVIGCHQEIKLMWEKSFHVD